MFFAFSGFIDPPTIYRYEFASGALSVFKRPAVDFDPERFVTDQVVYTSRDGTPVTMFLAHRKGLERKGDLPTLLYGYGGFNASETPWFGVDNLVWMELGGVLAVPNLRGGGEYGEAWHQGGMRERKQNVFDDFIAAAESLVANRYTRPGRLAIHGSSNGGLLVGACMTQRPDLFGACLPDVGVMDMLRFHGFTIGYAWVPEYGSSDDPEMFKALLAYSPYHNLRPGTKYPATLVTTADHDDRVVPLHSFKFAARLQACQAGDAPVLIRIETRAGHGAGTPTKKRIDEATDRLSFLTSALGVEVRRKFWKKD
jgi:prolyl oligopeptidase